MVDSKKVKSKAKKTNKKKEIKKFYKKEPKSIVKAMNLYSPFPAHYMCRCKYSHTSLLSVGTAGIYGTEQVFRLNAMYDPDFTGSGHQPYGRDQLQLIYNKYTVHGCGLDIEVTDPSEDGLVVAMMIQPSGSTYTLTSKTIDEIKEKTNGYTVNMNNTGSQVAKISQYVDIASVEGVTKSKIMNDDLYSSDFTADPSNNPYMRIAIGNLRGSGSGTCIVRCTLTYYVKCWGLVVLGQS